jgi:hypothetical protein
MLRPTVAFARCPRVKTSTKCSAGPPRALRQLARWKWPWIDYWWIFDNAEADESKDK